MKNTLNIKVIISSTRDGRFGDKPAQWIADLLSKREGVSVEVLDLKEIDLPWFTEAVSPAYGGGVHANPKVAHWAQKIKEADGYIISTAEYNHGYTSALKNALDSIYLEWANKPIGFVGYGSTGGSRAIEQLRQVAVELHMASVRTGVHIFNPWLLDSEEKVQATFAEKEHIANEMIDQIVLWATAFKTINS